MTLEDILKERKTLKKSSKLVAQSRPGEMGLNFLESFLDYNKTDRSNPGEYNTQLALNDRQLEFAVQQAHSEDKLRTYQSVLDFGYVAVLDQVTDNEKLVDLALSMAVKETGNEAHNALAVKIAKLQKARQKIAGGDPTPYLDSLKKRPVVREIMARWGGENLRVAALHYLDKQRKEIIKEAFVEGDGISRNKVKDFILSNESVYEDAEKVELYSATALALPEE